MISFGFWDSFILGNATTNNAILAIKIGLKKT